MKVLVIGGGPAGCAAAICLARRGVAVRLIEADAGAVKAGEVLAPAAVPGLSDLGFSVERLEQEHLPCPGIDRVWGGAHVARVDFAGRMQRGWHLDRAVFEAALRGLCRDAGVRVETGIAVERVERRAEGWLLELSDGRGVEADFLIDASGRRAVVARQLGVESSGVDRLVAFHCVANVARTEGPLVIEAVENGWWYTAPLPGGRRVFSFLTDSDLPAAHRVARADGFQEMLGATRVLSGFGFDALSPPKAFPATSRRLAQFGGAGWQALGDAAIGRDPLSGGGMAQALEDGRQFGEVFAACPKGDVAPLAAFNQHLEDVWASHERERAAMYAREGRWPWSPFWARRGNDTAARKEA